MSCGGINGYNVRLYNPQSSAAQLDVIRRIGANRTFYIINDEDSLTSSDENYVQVAQYSLPSLDMHALVPCSQVRVIHSTGVGEWSEGISLGN